MNPLRVVAEIKAELAAHAEFDSAYLNSQSFFLAVCDLLHAGQSQAGIVAHFKRLNGISA